MWEVPANFRVRVGGNIYINCQTLIAYHGEPLFNLRRHEDGYLGIDFEIYDANRNRIATVRRNEIYLGDKNAYTIDGEMDRYVVTENASGQVICDIRKRAAAGDMELDVSVHLYTPDGFLFDATPEQTNLPMGNILRNNTFMNLGTGIAIN